MSLLIAGLGMALAIEGLIYALFPGHLKSMIQMMDQVSPETLRTGGVIALGAGVTLIWFATRVLGT